MDKAGRKRRRLNVHDLTSIGKELLDTSYTGDLVLFKELAALLDRGRGCLSVAVDSVRDESSGYGVIHMAAAGGNLQLLEFLLVDLSLEADTSDGTGHSPLTYAIEVEERMPSPF